MIRGASIEFSTHSVQSSLAMPVNEMWKLCKAGMKSVARLSYTAVSAEFGTDF